MDAFGSYGGTESGGKRLGFEKGFEEKHSLRVLGDAQRGEGGHGLFNFRKRPKGTALVLQGKTGLSKLPGQVNTER